MQNYFEESIILKQALKNDGSFNDLLSKAIGVLDKCFQAGNKVMIAGNGGSAADAQHFVGEIVGRFKRERKGYPAIALTTDSSVMTAWANDYSFDSLFAREVEALGASGDVFIGISTSGNSENVVQAVTKAKNMGIKTICLLGGDGGRLKDLVDIALIIPSKNTPRVQELHIMLIHIICEEVEKGFCL